MSNATLPDLLTVTEVANLLRVHRNTIYDQARRGRLGHLRVAGRMLIPATELQAYVERGAVGLEPDTITALVGERDEKGTRR
jgi:excisionase family DNA binding protein